MLVHIRRAAAAELKGLKISHTVEKHELFTKRWKDDQPQKLPHEASRITTQNSREKVTQRRTKEREKFPHFFSPPLVVRRACYLSFCRVRVVVDRDAFKWEKNERKKFFLVSIFFLLVVWRLWETTQEYINKRKLRLNKRQRRHNRRKMFIIVK